MILLAFSKINSPCKVNFFLNSLHDLLTLKDLTFRFKVTFSNREVNHDTIKKFGPQKRVKELYITLRSFPLKIRSENRILFYFSTFVICVLWLSRSKIRLPVFRKY